jgi:hypothetical protein
LAENHECRTVSRPASERVAIRALSSVWPCQLLGHRDAGTVAHQDGDGIPDMTDVNDATLTIARICFDDVAPEEAHSVALAYLAGSFSIQRKPTGAAAVAYQSGCRRYWSRRKHRSRAPTGQDDLATFLPHAHAAGRTDERSPPGCPGLHRLPQRALDADCQHQSARTSQRRSQTSLRRRCIFSNDRAVVCPAARRLHSKDDIARSPPIVERPHEHSRDRHVGRRLKARDTMSKLKFWATECPAAGIHLSCPAPSASPARVGSMELQTMIKTQQWPLTRMLPFAVPFRRPLSVSPSLIEGEGRTSGLI